MKKLFILSIIFIIACVSFVTLTSAKTDIKFDMSDGGDIEIPAPEQICIAMTDGGDLDTPAPEQIRIAMTDGGDLDTP
jgi:hypothetical protein